MNKIPILVVSTSGMYIGGVEKSLIGLLNAFDYDKYEVDLFLYSHRGELFPQINHNVHVYPLNKDCDLLREPITVAIRQKRFYLAGIRLWNKFYCKIKKCNSRLTESNIRALTRRMKPLEKHYSLALGFFGPHDFLINKVDSDIKVGWIHTDYSKVEYDIEYTKWFWQKLDYIAAVSDTCGKVFAKLLPSIAEKVITIENITDTDYIIEQAGKVCPDEFKTQPEAFNICSVGRFCEAKAFDLVPEICKILIEKGYNIRWFLIGYGPDREKIDQAIKETKMDDHIIILGKKENPYPYIKFCDIYAQPSRYEGKAVTVTEAQILNKPVLITRYETATSQVKEGVDGYICEMGVEGVAKGLKDLIDHEEIRNRLIENTKKQKYGNIQEIEKIQHLAED